MSWEDPYRNDPRSVSELIAAALSDPGYDRDGWEAIAALHWRGSEETLDRAAELCRSFCAVERRVGADILGQLGIPDRTFPEECLSVLLEMLASEMDPEVLQSVLVALGHLGDPRAIEPASCLRRHSSSAVRDGVVHALMGYDDPLAIRSLIELSTDDDPRIRDWATFSLGSQTELDTPAIRDALAARLCDPDDDARGEALVGLARRGDPRVIPALCQELSSNYAGTLALEAAALTRNPRLLPELLDVKRWSDSYAASLGGAIAACSAGSGLQS